MTVLVGIKCRDGVVIGADSSATMGQAPNLKTIEQKTKKIKIIGDRIIVAGTGQAGLAQRFNATVESVWNDKSRPFQKHPLEVGKFLARHALQDFQFTGLQDIEFGALVAFPTRQQSNLCQFAVGDFQPELKTNDSLWYVSMGSGQSIIDPFLGLMRRVFWKDDPPSSQDGIFAVTWALQQAIEINPGGINGPMQIAVLRPNRKGQVLARLLEDSELDEHRNNVEGAITHLRSYARDRPADDLPALPEKPA